MEIHGFHEEVILSLELIEILVAFKEKKPSCKKYIQKYLRLVFKFYSVSV